MTPACVLWAIAGAVAAGALLALRHALRAAQRRRAREADDWGHDY